MFEDLKANVKDWNDDEEIERYLEALLDRKAFDKMGLIYGMGHAVYTISDPRQKILKGAVKQLAEVEGFHKEFDLYAKVEQLAPEVIGRKRKIYKGVASNVDFYSGAGWSAHRLEELINAGKIIRPAYMSISHERPYMDLYNR